jgi:hypothetical protein
VTSNALAYHASFIPSQPVTVSVAVVVASSAVVHSASLRSCVRVATSHAVSVSISTNPIHGTTNVA